MTTNSGFPTSQNHVRVNDTFLASLEKKALLGMATRMPAWVVPDTLTAIGLGASFLIFISYALTFFNPAFLWLASLGFVIQWFGDSLDGTLARVRKIERPRYGFFVDHLIDTVSEVLIFLGLGLSPYLHFDLALMAMTSYMLLATYVYLVTYVNGVFRISFWRLGPTETRVLAIIANTVVFFAGNHVYHMTITSLPLPVLPLPYTLVLTFFDLVAIGFTLLLSLFFVVSAVSTAMSLSRQDRINAADARHRRSQARKAHQKALRDERAMRKSTAENTQATSHLHLDD